MAAPLDPGCIFRVLADNNVEYVLIGGLAAVLHGSTAMTNDADVFPANDAENMRNLSAALEDLNARLRTESDPNGVAFDPHPALISSMATLNMTTRCGDLDMTFTPAGLSSYAGVRDNSIVFEISGCTVQVAALDDIIRSKESANRAKDHATLPILRALKDELSLGVKDSDG